MVQKTVTSAVWRGISCRLSRVAIHYLNIIVFVFEYGNVGEWKTLIHNYVGVQSLRTVMSAYSHHSVCRQTDRQLVGAT